MSKKMLIDAAHAEETRVVVVDGSRVEEFDFESRTKKQLRGNIYLAKVTRVEPSLQAAFVEYGGNRHGFLAFDEIHPDYYQIPVADREALMREEAEEARKSAPQREREAPASGEEGGDAALASDDDEDVMDEEIERRRRRLLRRYKIQEVIRRRQIMLVQVVKEERGSKGAALTTYLSLAGRYGVLMPNTARGGGISRKITAAADRKRLKAVVQELAVPEGIGLIVRTAGAKRTKAEIKRDYEYLLRLWENIRETTMNSVAPALIYEEEDLVKRAIRDLYDKDVEGVWVEGDAGYREARDFMRMLMPSVAKKVIAYTEPTPLFVKHGVEDHLAQIYSPVVPLRSGGYLVINQTEALVAVDVNSGKATRERNIEATALKTNMEAAEETCRQLRLRDLAGLIVIDFIDMEESKNNRAVEKKLKDCLAEDRARVQMGKISPFGLMEISRQRRRTGVLEATTHVCEHCHGAGRVRSVESSALSALRMVEMEALAGAGEITLRLPLAVALYVLNEKRAHLARLHQTKGLYVAVVIDEALGASEHAIERTMSGEAAHAVAPVEQALPAPAARPMMDEEEDDEEAIEREDTDDDEPTERLAESRGYERNGESEGGRNGRGRRRRRRGGRREEGRDDYRAAPAPAPEREREEADDEGGHRRRRGRRGGRRVRDEGRPVEAFGWTRPRVPFGDDPFVWHDIATLETPPPAAAAPAPAPVAAAPMVEASTPVTTEAVAPASTFEGEVWVELPAEAPKAPAKRRRSRAKAAPEAAPEVVEPMAEAAAPALAEVAAVAPEPEPTPEPAPEPVAAAPREPDPAEINTPPAAPRRGWWRRG